MADATSAGDAAQAPPEQETRADLIDELRVHSAEAGDLYDRAANALRASFDRTAGATFMERYAERLVAGPLAKDYGNPVNRRTYDAATAADIRTAVYSLAQALRAGVDTPEADWPMPGSAS